MSDPAPAARPRRSASLHWAAWLGALVSFAVLALTLLRLAPQSASRAFLITDLVLGLAFAVEFFTRTGWRAHRARYLAWHWFDFIALLPVLALDPGARWPLALYWILLVCRAIRLVDRTLGDGFVQRHALLILEAFEEEISDRVLEKMLRRWEEELRDANFGTAAAGALRRNRDTVLQRIYAEQLREGAFAKLAHLTGLQAALEREEARLFDAIIDLVGSKETDEAIRDVIRASLQNVRSELGQRTWRTRLGQGGPSFG